MSLWDKIRGEFVDVIEWLDPSQDTMVYRFERYENEIKYGARLIVREGQAAVFVNEGTLADTLGPGTYTLQTQNLPILSTLQGWKHGFESPFKAEVYFVSTRLFTGRKWGTMNPIMLRDPEFGPLRLRAFGSYAIRVKDPAVFLREVVGTDGHFTAEKIAEQLRNLIVSRFADVLGERRLAALDLAANYTELGEFVAQQIRPDFTAYGLELATLLVENISLPPAVEEALDKRTSMGVIGNLGAYTQYQAAQALEKAAENPGGLAAGGMGLGMGMAMAGPLGQALSAAPPAPAPGPPPLPAAPAFHVAIEGQAAGPFEAAALLQQVQAGTLTRETLVWRQGMAAWTPAGDVAELAALFAATPPPLPR